MGYRSDGKGDKPGAASVRGFLCESGKGMSECVGKGWRLGSGIIRGLGFFEEDGVGGDNA